MIKKAISTFVILLAVLMLTPSCTHRKENDKPYVIGTVFPQYDISRVIGGDDAECEMLLPPGTDSHGYKGDSPSDIYKIMNCDLFIYVGGETDSEWVEAIKDKIESECEKMPVFLSLCDICDLIEEDDAGIVENEEEELGEPEYDEHVWTSPKNAIEIAEAISDELCRLDSANAADYTARCKEYVASLRSLDNGFREVFDNAEKKILVFADRFPFRYLANEYDLTCYAAFNGCAAQAEPAPTTIVKLCKIVEEENLPYVFYIETSQSDVPELISKSCGCGTVLLHSCHTVTQKELDDGVSYLSIMQKNLENLRKALNDE